jgi:predicted dehydrogenase
MGTRVIQIGVGGRGKSWRESILGRADLEMACLVDIADEPLIQAREEFGLSEAALFRDYKMAFAEADADVALVVTPPFNHREIIELALESGMSVMTEKPLAATMEDCKAIVRAGKEAGKMIMVAQNYRFRPFIRAANKAIAQGAIGRLSHAVCSFRMNPDWGPFRKAMDHPMLIEMAIHHFDMARCILGRDPVSIHATSWNTAWTWFHGHPAVTATIMMDGNLPLIYEANATSQGALTDWNGSWRFEGEKGAFYIEREKMWIVRDNGKPEPVEYDDPNLDDPAAKRVVNINDMWDEFFAAQARERACECSAEDNLKSIGLVFAAIDSSADGELKRIADYL